MLNLSLSLLSIPSTLNKGVPLRITIGGVSYERVALDGAWMTIDGHPVYMEV